MFRAVSRLAALAIPLAAAPARADDTLLRLAESATVMVTPDELVASLRAEAVAPNPRDLQARVNDMMRDALALAKKVPGITVSTGGYTVWRASASTREGGERWQGGQTLNLTGKDAEAMLKLVGDLQQRGMAQSTLSWHLSRAAEQAARKEATRQAVSALRGRAEEAAGLLNLRFGSFREVRLDNVAPPPVMRPAMAMARGGAGAAPPSAEAEDMPVSARAEADVVLKPRE